MSDCYSDPYQNDYKAWLLGGIFLLVIFWHFSASAAICLQGKFKRLGIWQLSRWLLITELFTKTTPTIISVLIPSDLLITISSNTKSPKKKYRKTADTPSSVDTPSDDIGKIITIYVNREDPTDVVFKNSTHILLTTLCLIFPAGGFVGVGFMFRKAYQIKKDD